MLEPNSTHPPFHELALNSSRVLCVLFVVANSLGLLAIVVSGAPPWLKGAMLMALLAGGCWQWQRVLGGGSGRITALRWLESGFQVQLGHSGQWLAVKLSARSRRWPGWIVLHFELPIGRRCLLLPFDAADSEGLRRLRVLLHWLEKES